MKQAKETKKIENAKSMSVYAHKQEISFGIINTVKKPPESKIKNNQEHFRPGGKRRIYQ